jgi:hypothetical protein
MPRVHKTKNNRFQPFPYRSPTYEEYKANEEQWNTVVKTVNSFQERRQIDDFKERVEREKEEIEAEEETFVKEALKIDGWNRRQASPSDECYACEQRDVKEGYSRTVMKQDLFMCPACYNELHNVTAHDEIEGFGDMLRQHTPTMWSQRKNWVKEEYDSVHCSLRGDDCWYDGNTDRLDDYAYSYRLKGTTDVYFCDVCWDNHNRDFTVSMTEAIENYDD